MGRMHSRGFVKVLIILLLCLLYNSIQVCTVILISSSSSPHFVLCRKGISASALPYKRSPPAWLKTTALDVSLLRFFDSCFFCPCWDIWLQFCLRMLSSCLFISPLLLLVELRQEHGSKINIFKHESCVFFKILVRILASVLVLRPELRKLWLCFLSERFDFY